MEAVAHAQRLEALRAQARQHLVAAEALNVPAEAPLQRPLAPLPQLTGLDRFRFALAGAMNPSLQESVFIPLVQSELNRPFEEQHFEQQKRKAVLAQMRDEAECVDGDDTPEGLWDTDIGTIYLLKGLSRSNTRYYLMHEMCHAALDLMDSLDRDK